MPPFLFSRRRLLQLTNGGANSADDAVGGGLIGLEAEQFDWMLEYMRAKNDAIGFVTNIAKQQCVVGVHGTNVRPGRLMRYERVVMPIQYGNHSGAQYRLHGASLSSRDADCEEALPVAPS